MGIAIWKICRGFRAGGLEERDKEEYYGNWKTICGRRGCLIMKPNIFDYATSELSQDAFICWLMSFAMKDSNENKVLKECAKAFLRKFISGLQNVPSKDIVLTEPPKTQYNHIDILLTVNDKYKVIIEDKTSTKEHDNQLQRYADAVRNDFPKFEVCKVFYKTGFQSDYSEVNEADYIIINRNDILTIMEPYYNVAGSDILNDYWEINHNFKIEADKYKTLPIKEWNWIQVNAFYDDIKQNFLTISSDGKHKMNCNYGYVPNPSGGFDAMWIYDDKFYNIFDIKCELYLQIEYWDKKLNICIKEKVFESDDEKKKSSKSLRESVIWQKDENDNWYDLAKKFGFLKPSRFGNGKTMTIGIFDREINTYSEAVSALTCSIDNFYDMLQDLEKTVHPYIG